MLLAIVTPLDTHPVAAVRRTHSCYNGEGEKAFRRLQEEIIKVLNDQSLFAWISSKDSGGLLATSPADFFLGCNAIPSRTSSGVITINSEGIHLNVLMVEDASSCPHAILYCQSQAGQAVILLKATSEKEGYFQRIQKDRLEFLSLERLENLRCREKRICIRQGPPRSKELPLFVAVVAGNKIAVELLLDMSANLKSQDKDGRTPLSLAANNGHKALVRLLLEKGANVTTAGRNRCVNRTRSAM